MDTKKLKWQKRALRYVNGNEKDRLFQLYQHKKKFWQAISKIGGY